MRIVVLVRILWTGGAQKIAIKEAQNLQKFGHSVRLVFLRETESGKLLHDSLKNVNWEIYSKSGGKNPLYSFITAHFSPDRKGEGTVDYDLITNFANRFSRDDADYVICHDQFAGIAGYKIKKRLGIPYSVFMHERVNGYPSYPVFGKLARYLERKVLSHADAVFSVTERVAESVEKIYSISSIPNMPGIDVGSCMSYESRRDILLSVSVWDTDRDPKVYLPIISKLRNFKLTVAGRWRDEGLRKQFIAKLDELKIGSSVNLIEGFTENQLVSLYSESKFSLRYGIDELGPGMSNLESLSQCTPVIVNGELGFADFVLSEDVGYVSKIWNPDDICEFIIEYDNHAKYSELQSNIKKAVSSHSWGSHTEIILEPVIGKK